MTATGTDAVASEVTIVLPALSASITEARRFVRDTVHGWGLTDLDDDLQLGTSELVTNAVRHARTQFAVTVRLDDVVTVLVEDGGPELHLGDRAPVGPTDENGRGLRIVAAISRAWGVLPTDSGKIIWFSMALPPPRDDQARDADVLPLVR